MKPIPIILSPTRNRAFNVFLGLLLSLVSVLLFLALATYHPADPSMNTASGADPAHAVQPDEDRPGQMLAVAARGGSTLSRAKRSPSAAGILRTSPVPVLAYGPALLARLCASDRQVHANPGANRH